MSSKKGGTSQYSYSFQSGPAERVDTAAERATRENLLSIRQTLLLLTGGCEVVERQDGFFCQKHDRLLIEGESRCDYVSERFSAGSAEEQTRAEIQRYVNDLLGIKDPKNVKRLTG